jgi:uncharacterized protein
MLEDKETTLRSIVRALGSAAVAYSGGVDSTLLLRVCRDELGETCAAVTARSETYPEREFHSARQYAKSLGVNHIVIYTSELSIPGFAHNPPDRCYHCKRELFSKIRAVADAEGLKHVLDGTNADDPADYRPGLRATEELGVRQPLREAGLTKADVRELSKKLGLPTWDRPAQACLASRFPYGSEITKDALAMVAAAEDYLRSLGVKQCRVRHHGTVARIELSPEDIARFMDEKARREVVAKFRQIGYKYVTLDLQGYRTGSMNETL